MNVSYAKTLRQLHPHPAYVEVWRVIPLVNHRMKVVYRLYPTRTTREYTDRVAMIRLDKVTVISDGPSEEKT